MRRYFPGAGSGNQYRRGAIMGLTVAEAFMLIAFVLLMLLLFWRNQVQDAVELVSMLAQEDKQALSEGATPVPPERLAELQEQARLVEDPERRALAEAVSELPPEELRRLTDLVRRPEMAAAIKALSEGATPVPPERLAELQEQARLLEHGPDEINEALQLREALDPYGEDSNEILLDKIGELQARQNAFNRRLAEDERARQNFVNNIKRELSDLVEKAGGRIDMWGRIAFPERVVFESGQAEIPARFGTWLDEICPPWLNGIRKSAEQRDIAEIRIEGHSSPEWASAQTEQDAWVENLGLSQRRAQSVLVHCLAHVGGTPLGDWARGKLTAVGYSSSRPVITGEGEDWRASRRVVLGHEFSRDELLSDLGDVTTDGGAIRPIQGPALVTDADTIKIGGIGIRLDGIDAPDLKQPCFTTDGDEWNCGKEARRALERRIADRPVVCDRLHLDLRRYRGRCRIDGESEDLNRWVVREGWAFAYSNSGDYANDAAEARAAQRGIWNGRAPMPPWEWRAARKRAAAQ